MVDSPGMGYRVSRRVVVGITGATGALYGVRLLQRLRATGHETHLVASPAGMLNVHHELGLGRKALEALADVAYNPADVGARIASGSFATQAMVVAPCSMKSLAAVGIDRVPMEGFHGQKSGCQCAGGPKDACGAMGDDSPAPGERSRAPEDESPALGD